MAEGDFTAFAMTDLSEALTSADGNSARIASRQRLDALMSRIDSVLKAGVGVDEYDRLIRIQTAATEALALLG